MRGDLHCHTNKSDGSMAPREVVDYAGCIGLDCLAITDHDTFAGISEAEEQARLRKIRLIKGMEVSTFDYKHHKRVHLLCLNPGPTDQLTAFCAETLKKRYDAAVEMTEKVSSKYPLDFETVKNYVQGCPTVYRQHILMALMNRGYSLSVFGELYKELFSSKGGWALVEVKLPETRDALELIKQSGGLAVLAHPGVYHNFDVIDELCGLGLDGIECFHPRQSADDEKAAVAAAQKYGILKTGGSDFHGYSTTIVNPLASRITPDSELNLLLERFNNKL